MIPQRKPTLPDPWAHVEQRRQPAANDAEYADDGETENNWTMLLSSICGIVVVAVVLAVAAWSIGKAVWHNRAGLLESFAESPWFWGMGAAAAAGLVLSFVVVRALRNRRERRLNEELRQQLSGGAR